MSEQQEPIAGAPQGPSPRRPAAPALHMCEVLLDPQMAAGMMTFEGVSFPFIRIAHPRYGVIDCLIPVVNAKRLVLTLVAHLGMTADEGVKQ